MKADEVARWEVNHAWIDWALKRAGYEACTCSATDWGMSLRGTKLGVVSRHYADCPQLA